MTGNQFAALRQDLGHSQRVLAAALGLAEATVPKWEGRKEDDVPKYGAVLIRQYAFVLHVQGLATEVLVQKD